MSKEIVALKLSEIDKIHLLVTNCTKTLSQTYTQIKNQYPSQKVYILNGGMWNPDGSPCVALKVDGQLLSQAPSWSGIYGYGWDNVSNIQYTNAYKNFTNFISCTSMIANGAKINLNYASAQGGTRGRSAIGMTQDSIILYCSQDGSSDAKTPEKLQDEMFSLGCQSAIMLDSGGSSMCNFNGATVVGDGRKVDNWIVVVMKGLSNIENNTDKEEDTQVGYTIVEKYITQNPCYTKQTKVNKTKFMLHSTGTPGGTASAIRNNMNKASATAAVEFVLDNTGIYQLLPLGIKSWHAGGTANNSYLSCEVCEPIQTRLIDINWQPLSRNGKSNTTWAVTQLQKELTAWGYDPNGIDGSFGPGCKAAVKQFQKDNGLSVDGSVGPATKAKLATREGSYLKYNPNDPETKAFFDDVYGKAVWLFAEILKQVGGKASEIICHSEGYQLGIASNHADVNHWFPLHGKTMDVFRADVEKAMNGEVVTPTPTPTPVPTPETPSDDTTSTTHWAQEYYDALVARGVQLSDTRFDDKLTRGEAFALADKILTALGK